MSMLCPACGHDCRPLVPALRTRAVRFRCPACGQHLRALRNHRPAPPSHAFAYSDGGRSAAGFEHERNDCSVRAWAEARGIPYAEAHAAFKAAGRQDRRGTPGRVSWDVMGRPTHVLPRTGPGAMTVARFLALHPVGRYVIHVARHAFAVVDGRQLDHQSLYKPRARVSSYWKVEKA